VREQQRAAAALAAALAPLPNAPSPAGAGAGASGVTVKLEVGAEETLGQLRDRLDLPGSARAPASGRRATFVHIKVEDSTSGEDTDGVGQDTGWGGGEGEEEGGEDEEQQEVGVWEREGEEEMDVAQIGGGKRERVADNSTVVALSDPLRQLAASAPPPPQHVDMKWVEGQGEQCTRTSSGRNGSRSRCSSRAVFGRGHCVRHTALTKAQHERARLKRAASQLPLLTGDDEGDVGDGGGGGGDRVFTSKFRGVAAQSGSVERWKAAFRNSGKYMHMGTFSSEEDAARARDRMLVWCHLHGVVLHQRGRGAVHTSDSIKAALNFAYDEYVGEVDELKNVMTQDDMVQKLQQGGRAQPGGRKRKRA